MPPRRQQNGEPSRQVPHPLPAIPEEEPEHPAMLAYVEFESQYVEDSVVRTATRLPQALPYAPSVITARPIRRTSPDLYGIAEATDQLFSAITKKEKMKVFRDPPTIPERGSSKSFAQKTVHYAVATPQAPWKTSGFLDEDSDFGTPDAESTPKAPRSPMFNDENSPINYNLESSSILPVEPASTPSRPPKLTKSPVESVETATLRIITSESLPQEGGGAMAVTTAQETVDDLLITTLAGVEEATIDSLGAIPSLSNTADDLPTSTFEVAAVVTAENTFQKTTVGLPNATLEVVAPSKVVTTLLRGTNDVPSTTLDVFTVQVAIVEPTLRKITGDLPSTTLAVATVVAVQPVPGPFSHAASPTKKLLQRRSFWENQSPTRCISASANLNQTEGLEAAVAPKQYRKSKFIEMLEPDEHGFGDGPYTAVGAQTVQVNEKGSGEKSGDGAQNPKQIGDLAPLPAPAITSQVPDVGNKSSDKGSSDMGQTLSQSDEQEPSTLSKTSALDSPILQEQIRIHRQKMVKMKREARRKRIVLKSKKNVKGGYRSVKRIVQVKRGLAARVKHGFRSFGKGVMNRKLKLFRICDTMQRGAVRVASGGYSQLTQ